MTSRGWMLLVVAMAGCDALDDEYVPADHPVPIANDDHVTIEEDSLYAVKPSDLVANDGPTGAIEIVTEPVHGTWTQYGYTPALGYHGPDSLTYRLRDSYGQMSEIARVSIGVASDGIGYEEAFKIDDSAAQDVAVGDLGGDGKIDLVLVDPKSSNIVILDNRTTAPGAFAVEAFRFEGGHAPVSIAVADIDRDGKLDVVTASGADGLVVLRNITAAAGPLAFAAPIYLPMGDAVAVVAVDLNGDGLLDLASLDKQGSGMDVRINASTPGSIDLGTRFSFATPTGPTRLLASDADADGVQDLAVLSRTAGALSLFVNATVIGDTVPAFQTRVDRATGTMPIAMFLADLDGDSKDEIAVLHDGGSTSDPAPLWIYANRTPSAGQPPMYEAARVLAIETEGQPFVAALDLDGQGPVDVFAATSNDAPFVQLLNATPQPGAYAFESFGSDIVDVAKRARASMGRPTGIVRVDLDGVPPLEIVVTSTFSYSGATFVLFDR